MTPPAGTIDTRFSDPAAGPTSWADAVGLLAEAESYWLTTVRGDGRPHVTPLIAVVDAEVAHFCTGVREQKAHNLEVNPHVALTAGASTWAAGLDVVVEGTAVRVLDRAALQHVADTYERKYGSAWHFEVGDAGFTGDGGEAAVFRIEAAKVIAFAKDPHGQTTFRP